MRAALPVALHVVLPVVLPVALIRDQNVLDYIIKYKEPDNWAAIGPPAGYHNS